MPAVAGEVYTAATAEGEIPCPDSGCGVTAVVAVLDDDPRTALGLAGSGGRVMVTTRVGNAVAPGCDVAVLCDAAPPPHPATIVNPTIITANERQCFTLLWW